VSGEPHLLEVTEPAVRVLLGQDPGDEGAEDADEEEECKRCSKSSTISPKIKGDKLLQ
jgi:hypothetical protein